MLNARFLTLVCMTLVAAATRLVPHPPNVTPIAAMALFGGAHFASPFAAVVVPLSAMFLSDLLLGFGLHPVMPFVYGSFAFTVCLGRWLRGRRSPLAIALATVRGSVVFFVVTNLGVWLVGDLYPRTLDGLVTCYIAAVPFFRNTLVGDAFYTVVLFGGFALAQRYFPALDERGSSVLGLGDTGSGRP
jgi:hypothetical protein